MPTKSKGTMKGHTIKGGHKRSTKSGAGMTKKGVAKYRKDNPGSKLKTAVTGKVKKGSKDAKRRKSYCEPCCLGVFSTLPVKSGCCCYTVAC